MIGELLHGDLTLAYLLCVLVFAVGAEREQVEENQVEAEVGADDQHGGVGCGRGREEHRLFDEGLCKEIRLEREAERGGLNRGENA